MRLGKGAWSKGLDAFLVKIVETPPDLVGITADEPRIQQPEGLMSLEGGSVTLEFGDFKVEIWVQPGSFFAFIIIRTLDAGLQLNSGFAVNFIVTPKPGTQWIDVQVWDIKSKLAGFILPGCLGQAR